MAIDTATKRASALLDPDQAPYPPDGGFSYDDRGVMLEFYSGVPSSSFAPDNIVYLLGAVAAAPSLAGSLTASFALSGRVPSTLTIEASI